MRLKLLTLGVSIWGRGVVTEEPTDARAQRRLAAQASKARPLPAHIDVLGINHTIKASPEFGTYYRCAQGLGDCKGGCACQMSAFLHINRQCAAKQAHRRGTAVCGHDRRLCAVTWSHKLSSWPTRMGLKTSHAVHVARQEPQGVMCGQGRVEKGSCTQSFLGSLATPQRGQSLCTVSHADPNSKSTAPADISCQSQPRM